MKISINLSKFYTSRKRDIVVFNEAHAEFNEGILSVLSGESGTGKTTLLEIISGKKKADKGGVTFIGCSKSDAFLVSDKEVFPHLSIDENISFIDNGLIDKDSLLELLGLTSVRKSSLRHLSKGQYKRFLTAYTLIRGEKIILLDEPFANLDEDNCLTLRNLLYSMCEQRIIIISSHKTDILTNKNTTIYQIQDNKIVIASASSTLPEIKTIKPEITKKEALAPTALILKAKRPLVIKILCLLFIPIILLSASLLINPNISVDSDIGMSNQENSFKLIINQKDNGLISHKEIENIKKNHQIFSIGLDPDEYSSGNPSYNIQDITTKNKFSVSHFGKYRKQDTVLTEGREPENENEILVADNQAYSVGSKVVFSISFDHFVTSVELELEVVGKLKLNGNSSDISDSDKAKFEKSIFVNTSFFSKTELLDLNTDRFMVDYFLNGMTVDYYQSTLTQFDPTKPETQTVTVAQKSLGEKLQLDKTYYVDVYINNRKQDFSIPVMLSTERVCAKDIDFNECISRKRPVHRFSIPIRQQLNIIFEDRNAAIDFYIKNKEIYDIDTRYFSVDIMPYYYNNSTLDMNPITVSLLAVSILVLLLSVAVINRTSFSKNLQKNNAIKTNFVLKRVFLSSYATADLVLITLLLCFGFNTLNLIISLSILFLEIIIALNFFMIWRKKAI